MNDDDAEDWISAQAPQEVFDDYSNKDTLDGMTDIEIMKYFLQ